MIQALRGNLGWLVLFIGPVCSIRVGHINNVEYRTISSVPVTVNGTCTECTCQHLSLGGSVSFEMFNCYVRERKCDLYLNYSRRYNLLVNNNSIFYFFESAPPLPACYDINQNSTLTASSYTNTILANDSSSILWSFDSNYVEASNIYNGTGMNSPSFVSPGYAGIGSALSLNGSFYQYVSVTSPYHNLSYRSLTVSAWIYSRNLTSQQDFVLFSQCPAISPGMCLLCMFRSAKLFLAFFYNDCVGTTPVSINQWHHVAYMYDYSTMSQRVFLNGNQECLHSPSAPYQGTSGAMNIGLCYASGGCGGWNGYIDQLSIVHRAKSAIEVLDDATLVAYYSFDDPTLPSLDSGPLGINGIVGSNVSSGVPGRVNQGLLLPGISSGSFFQMTRLRRLGIQNYPFSISLWLNPTSVNSGTIVHLSSDAWGTGWCAIAMGLSSTGQLVSSVSNYDSFVSVSGPVLPTGVWTHVASTYSTTNGIRLYISDILVGSANASAHSASGIPMTITLGNALNGSNCTRATQPTPYRGLVDEFRLYSRELSAADLCLLANP